MGELTSALLTALVSAGFAATMGRCRDRRHLDRTERRRTANRILPGMLKLQRRLERRDDVWPLEKWETAVRATFGAMDEVSLPHSWRHLKRSLRAAVGEATGVAFVDLSCVPASAVASFDGTWLDFAGEYFRYCTSRVVTWRDASSTRVARRIGIEDFDAWLRITERYETGRGIWPGAGS